jgi:hypothetical protein
LGMAALAAVALVICVARHRTSTSVDAPGR